LGDAAVWREAVGGIEIGYVIRGRPETPEDSVAENSVTMNSS
jgi:hypothetical protein